MNYTAKITFTDLDKYTYQGTAYTDKHEHSKVINGHSYYNLVRRLEDKLADEPCDDWKIDWATNNENPNFTWMGLVSLEGDIINFNRRRNATA